MAGMLRVCVLADTFLNSPTSGWYVMPHLSDNESSIVEGDVDEKLMINSVNLARILYLYMLYKYMKLDRFMQ